MPPIMVKDNIFLFHGHEKDIEKTIDENSLVYDSRFGKYFSED